MSSLETVRLLLQEAIKPDTASKKAVYFKTSPGHYGEHDRFLGITNPALRAIALQVKDLSIAEIKELLTSCYNEERLLALFLLVEQYKKASEDKRLELYNFYLSHTSFINNWNLVDASAHLIVGAYLFTREKESLIRLAQSSSLWERRISIIATWYFIRKGQLEWTFTLCRLLLKDNHDLIHKAVGWMLREAGKKNKQMLKQFLDMHAPSMPRTMLRYALEKCSKEEQQWYRTLPLLKREL